MMTTALKRFLRGGSSHRECPFGGPSAQQRALGSKRHTALCVCVCACVRCGFCRRGTLFALGLEVEVEAHRGASVVFTGCSWGAGSRCGLGLLEGTARSRRTRESAVGTPSVARASAITVIPTTIATAARTVEIVVTVTAVTTTQLRRQAAVHNASNTKD